MKKLTWYNEMGFYNNPFSIKPAVFHNELFGNASAISMVTKKIEKPGIIFISGEFGTGKTTVLKKLVGKFRAGRFGKKKIIYYNCNQGERSINYDKLLIGAGGFFRRLFGIRRKEMIIFLDEMQDMNQKDLDQVKKYYDDGFFKSVVFVSKYDDLDLGEDLEYLIGKNKFKLGNMTKPEAVKMVRERIGNLKFVSDSMIVKIFEKDKNSRSFLKNCEDVCRVAFEDESSEVLDDHVLKVLG